MKAQQNDIANEQGRSLAINNTVGRAYGERGVQISGAFYVGMGASIDIQLGVVNRTGTRFLSVSVNGGLGLDIGVGAGIFTSYYSHGENAIPNYSPATMEGKGWFVGGGMGLGYSYSTSYIPINSLRQQNYQSWTTHTINMGGAKIGGCLGFNKTYIPCVW